MDKQPVGQLPDLTQSNNDDEIMVITNSEYNQLKKEKISDLITDFTSTNENNAIVKGTDGKMFVTDFGNASNITEGTLPTSVLPEIPLDKIPDIPKDKLPEIETDDLPDSGITAGTYTYPTDIVVNSKGQVTSITEGQAGANNANQDLSNLGPLGLDKINQSKALETGSVSSDADVYADIQKYAHSTFDLSKFEVVGSPTITEDGILDCKRNDFVKIPFAPQANTDYRFDITFGIDQINLPGDGYIVGNGSNSLFELYKYNSEIYFNYRKSDPSQYKILTSFPLSVGVWNCFVKFNITTKSITVGYKTEAQEEYTTQTFTADSFFAMTSCTIGVIKNPCSIDLKSISITADGVPVFNGNITGTDTYTINEEETQIPYTLSKTGSKIVDVAYRDRVQDMYEQYGYAPYYTIDEENENFTLPMGEIYGMIAQNKTFDSFSLFDTKLTDRILTGDEALGWALQGSLVTMTYPDAVNRIKEEYAEGTVAYIKQNLPLPEFTSNTTNGITVSDSGGHDDAYSLINGVSTMYTTGPWSSYWFNIDYDEQTYIKTYSLKADNSGNAEYPSAWTLQANNGGDTDWVTLDTQTAQTFTKNQQKTYPVNSETSYRQYRIVFSDGEETSGGNGELSQISFDVDNILFEYKTAVNGHLIADISQKTAIDTLYSETGIADFYILDSTNNQFYLPRNKYFMQLTDSTTLLNNYNKPGLPNITGTFDGIDKYAGDPTGAFAIEKSSAVYGNSETVQPPSSNKLLYYKVGHTVTNSGSIDVANVLSDINLLEANKADKDLSNCTKPYVTETYQNGASWYRVWSDGWCEQGGLLPSASSAQKVTVTFLKTFSNTNYNIFKNVAANNSDGVSYRVVSFYDKQLSQADTYATAGGSGIATWEAHGFI